MKKLISLVFFVLLYCVSFSQNEKPEKIFNAEMYDILGDACYQIGDYHYALIYYEQSAKGKKKILGKNNLEYAKSLATIGCVYSDMGNEKKAASYLKKASDAINGDNMDKARLYMHIGTIFNSKGDYKNALECFFQALEITEQVLDEKNTEYAELLENIGYTYLNMGNFENALNYINQALGIYNPNDLKYTGLLNDIGMIYYSIGDNQRALTFLTLSHVLMNKFYGDELPEDATTISNIGLIYCDMGDYQKALEYDLRAMEIRGKVLGEEHSDYIASLNNISIVYGEIGDYYNALKYMQQALETIKKKSGENNYDYARSLVNIGNIYNKMGDNQNALKHLSQALKIQKSTIGEEHPDYAASLDNIGNVYKCMGVYPNAIKYYTQANGLYKKVSGEKHPDYAKSLNNIGTVYTAAGDGKNALKYYNQALEIIGTAYGEDHYMYAKLLGNIGLAHSIENNYTEAINANKQATDISKSNLIKNFSFMTAHEREAYWNAHNNYFSQNINYAYNAQDNALATKVAYDSELITKGLLLASEISVSNIIMESDNQELISEYEAMRYMHKILVQELEKPIKERAYKCDVLEAEIQKKERHIMENCKEFGDVTHFIKINWEEVQNSLKDNDVAIEFSNFTKNDTTIYMALVLTKNMEAPVCVPLFEQSEMQKLQRGGTSTNTKTSATDENRGATAIAGKRQGIYESAGLYEMIWKPMEKYFPANPRIYFAPSGMLHQIAIEYAPVDKGKLISDKYEMYRVSSTRYLAMDYTTNPLENSVLYGGIYYDSDTTTMKQESERYSDRSATYTSFADFNKGEDHASLPYLQGTKKEVEVIADKMKKKNISTTLYEGNQASEESFKALSDSVISVLHIATHGFFMPSSEKLSGDQSLVQSGLLLAGANHAWQNQPLPEDVEDGILTAKEISFMDLRNTDLVVLSACQTALGEITGEGVFGLQRGFKKAGARTIIMSLWPVDDNATLLMMTEFYTNLTKGMSKREAFNAAQSVVKKTKGFENPRYWAAFIMLDGNDK